LFCVRLICFFSGNWNEGFDDQGDNGNLWSASAFPDDADNALFANFNADEVNPANNNDRAAGVGVALSLVCYDSVLYVSQD
jgi:hypothetical protein